MSLQKDSRSIHRKLPYLGWMIITVGAHPGLSKDKIMVNVHDGTLEVKSEDPQREYHRTIEIPPETDIETAKSAYNNGILEITFKKKEQTKGKTIKVE